MKKEILCCDECEESCEDLTEGLKKCSICIENVILCPDCMSDHFENEHLEDLIEENTEEAEE